MKATLLRTWNMLDFSKAKDDASRHTEVQPGVYEIERIEHPRYPNHQCLVLKGTTIGMAEPAFRQRRNEDNATGVQRIGEIWIEE